MEVKVIVEKVNKLLVCPQVIIGYTYEKIIKADYHTETQLLYDLYRTQFGPMLQCKLFFTSLYTRLVSKLLTSLFADDCQVEL